MNIEAIEISDKLMETNTIDDFRVLNICNYTSCSKDIDYRFTYSTQYILFSRTRLNKEVELFKVYNIKDLPEKYTDMILLDKLQRL